MFIFNAWIQRTRNNLRISFSFSELRALAKAAPYLESLEYYTGNESEDKDVLKAVEDLLTVVKYVLVLCYSYIL